MALKVITAQWSGKCKNTGKAIAKGERCYWDTVDRKLVKITQGAGIAAPRGVNMKQAQHRAGTLITQQNV